jgi:hypothetical protein
MKPPQPNLRTPLAAILIATITGTASASSGPIPLGDVIEWVEISIHMPDGRVIKTSEPRYPSRSRVHITTGELPPFKRSDGGAAQGGDFEMGVELVEDPNDLIEELAPEALDSTGSDEGVVEQAIEVSDENQESAEAPSGAVRQFKKSS